MVFFLCVLSIALSVVSVPIANYSVASSLYAVLHIPGDRALRRHIHSFPPQYTLPNPSENAIL